MNKAFLRVVVLVSFFLAANIIPVSHASGDKEQIETVCNYLMSAMQRGDMSAIKSCTTGSYFTDLPADALKVMGEKWQSVENIDVQGDTAVAQVGIKMIQDKKILMNLVKSNGQWLVKDYKPPW